MKHVLPGVVLLAITGLVSCPAPAEDSTAHARMNDRVSPAAREHQVDSGRCNHSFYDLDPRSYVSMKKLIGIRVINPLEEDVGRVADLVVDRVGCITGLVIRIGGFMGMGGEYARISMNKVRIRSMDGPSGLIAMVYETRENILSDE